MYMCKYICTSMSMRVRIHECAHVCVRTHLGVLHVSMYTCMSAHVHGCGGNITPIFYLNLLLSAQERQDLQVEGPWLQWFVLLCRWCSGASLPEASLESEAYLGRVQGSPAQHEGQGADSPVQGESTSNVSLPQN